MPLQIQLGDLANRVVRAFGVRGRVPLSLDEQIVPVAVVEFPSDPPFCDVPQFWGTSIRATPVLATDRAMVGVRCVSGVAMLDLIAAGMCTAAMPLVVQLNRNQTSGLTTTDQIFTLNQRTEVNVGAAFPRPSMLCVDGHQPGVPGIQIWRFEGQTTLTSQVDFAGLCLYPGDEVLICGTTVNVAFEASLRGRWYAST